MYTYTIDFTERKALNEHTTPSGGIPSLDIGYKDTSSYGSEVAKVFYTLIIL